MTYMKNTLRQPKLETLNSKGDFFFLIKDIKIYFFQQSLFKLVTGGVFFSNYFPVLANYYFLSFHSYLTGSNYEKKIGFRYLHLGLYQ